MRNTKLNDAAVQQTSGSTLYMPLRFFRACRVLLILGFAALAIIKVELQGSGTLFPTASAQQAIKPFPQNRVQHFYATQAEHWLSSKAPIPPILPQFPGMDGGGFGHWGQNPEEASADFTLNQIQTGNVVSHVIHHFGKITNKAVAIQLGESGGSSVLFDPERATYVDAWRDGFLFRNSGRFGLMGGIRPEGTRMLDLTSSSWNLPEKIKYHGFYRHGRDVVFSYSLGEASILDMMSPAEGGLIRSVTIDGPLPENTTLDLMQLTGARSGSASDSKSASQPEKGDKGESQRLDWLHGTNSERSWMIALRSSDDGFRLTDFGGIARVSTATSTSDTGSKRHFTIWMRQADDAATLIDNIGEHFPKAVHHDAGDAIQSRTKPATGQWTAATVTTHLIPGSDDSAYAIDTLEVPYDVQNAFRTPMRLGGVGALSDGTIVVSTLIGDVWTVRETEPPNASNGSRGKLRWQRFAAGLFQPLGLVVQNDQILVLGRDQITRLHDHNSDGEADYYECLNNQYPTTDGHDFCTSLQQDASGRLHWFTASNDWGVTRMSDTGPEPLSNGLRNSNGIGVSPDGSILFATVQEGTWTPASAIFEVSRGSYHGLKGPRDGHGEYGYDLPMCFLPRGVDNSSGELCFLPDDPRLGPLAGQIVGSSFGNCSHYLVLREPIASVDGENGQQNRLRSQGAIMPLPGEFLSGACRFTYSRKDGCLYVAGTEGWQSYARENGCLQRIRFTGKSQNLPTAIETHSNGLLVRFASKVDPSSVIRSNIFCQQWNYLYSAAYGSPEYSILEPERTGHDYVDVRSVHVLPDQKGVFLEIPQLHPVMQFHIHMRLKDAEGQEFVPDLYATIHSLKPDFKEFEGYQLFAKKRPPAFPRAEKLALDPRLEQQDRLGKDFGWVQQAVKLNVNATPGLQFEPRRLRIAPGAKVALTFQNTDPSMPHNVAIVRADRMETFGEASMMLASNPRAIATHYVPDDPAEICFSPILNPNEKYTVFFEAPQEAGEYRMICTYPGHWRVMRGSLYVLPDDQPLPALSAEEQRKFVKQWTVDDFASEVTQLRNRNYERGKIVFSQAGCIKCHRVGSEGERLGPELTKISERFQGVKLLQQVLDPSTEINKQYQTWVAVTNEGQTVTGLMVEQTDDHISLLPNPLKPDTKVTLQRADLEELFASPQSTMPAGLLMVYNRDEILDLMAFVQSGGQAEDSAFQK